MTSRFGCALAISIVNVSLVSCVLAYDQKGGAAIADEIRTASPATVQEVAYVEGDFMDGARVDIVMRADATVDEAEALMCDVVQPIFDAGDPPDSLVVLAFDEGGSVLAGYPGVSCTTPNSGRSS
jgi:hypothetical protein